MEKIIEQYVLETITQLQKDQNWGDFALLRIGVERPKDLSFGDWTTNIAFVLAKELKQSPFAIAQKIASTMNEVGYEQIAEVVALKPGYINFILAKNVLSNAIEEILAQKDQYGTNDSLLGQTITVEYTQPNPFKPFHIGHLMSNAIGESVSRIIAFSGARIVRVNYQGDVGPHVAKALWAIQKYGYDVTDINQIGQAYAKGHAASEDDEIAAKEIKAINAAVYNGSDMALMKTYAIGREKTLERFEQLYKILGTHFDHYYFESETWKKGEEIVRAHIGDIFEESDGAIIFKGEKYGLHTRVFITAQGLPTYEAKEIGLAFLKKEKSPADLYVITTAVEQEEYFKVVKKALELIDATFEGKLKHVSHGMMQLASGKMSSRKGNVVTGESLIEDAQIVAKQKMSERVNSKVVEDAVNAIAIAGVKFSILKQRAGKNIVYDADAALSFDGDSGPYLQYTYARCQSVTRKASENDIAPGYTWSDVPGEKIAKQLVQFGEVAQKANQEYAPHYIANYLLELARMYNAYYAENIIVDVNKKEQSMYRTAITIATGQVIKNGLNLLGISAPEKM